MLDGILDHTLFDVCYTGGCSLRAVIYAVTQYPALRVLLVLLFVVLYAVCYNCTP